ncbi:rhodanese-related sulfurtransferase [Brevibacterium samyangense]|uniref:tRNA uridine(34) hydroxylase n=2 Tax=Brevibacterium samyangense TaxID=366888 RepID=A0ABP5F0E8_9MICO
MRAGVGPREHWEVDRSGATKIFSMAVHKIVLFYVFTPLADPEAVRLWQHALAESCGLKGRVIVSPDGINATVGGEIDDVKKYVRVTKSYAPFKKADIKWSTGTGDDFPRLSVKVRPELVTFKAPDTITVTEDGVQGGGTHLKPGALHKLVEERGDDVVFFDGRNAMEAEIGRFRGAIVPETDTTRDFIEEIDSGKYDHLKDKPIVTYCTGGIRCEVLSVLMKNRGFEEVYQVDGGIVRYAETFGTSGLWDGSLYVFDKRMHVEYGENVKSLGSCAECGEPTPIYVNCANEECRKQFLRCETCTDKGAHPFCGDCVPTGAPAESSPEPTAGFTPEPSAEALAP